MSKRDDSQDDFEEEPPTSQSSSLNDAYSAKIAVHERDRNTCICCREVFEDTSHLDADHVVPRGQGGPDTIRNQTSLCPRCHEAKHNERAHAPTIRWMSTGDMTDDDFTWFRHFWNDQFPALTQVALGRRIKPMKNLNEDSPYYGWHLPLGEVRRIDEELGRRDDVRYASVKAHHYM